MLSEVLYVRWRVPVRYRAGVQRPVVTARPQTSILLWDDVVEMPRNSLMGA